MRRLAVWSLLLLAAYGATGLYVVRGNEQALVRRCGKADLALTKGGLHLDLPLALLRASNG